MLTRLDFYRARILKESLKVSFFKNLFNSRADRILMFSILTLGFYFFVAQFFPMWVLLIGPVMWGIPHLISSLRYSSFAFEYSGRNKFFSFQYLVWLGVFAYRIAVDIYHIPLFLSSTPLMFEGICLLLSFLYLTYLDGRISVSSFTSLGLLIGLLLSTFFHPIETALVLFIGHNYVALLPWYKSCQTKKDRTAFWAFTALYIALSVAIYFGAIDPVYRYFSPSASIEFLGWNYFDIVASFGALPEDHDFWFRIVSLFAFSQSVHYFIWMKAVPENYIPQQNPQTFQWSFDKLTNDFGISSVYFLLALVLIGVGFWFVFEFQMARLVYFAFASYHGFMEISALAFLKSNRK